MFEFLKYLGDEVKGFDHDKIEKEKIEKSIKKKNSKLLIPLSVKTIIYTMGVLYIIVGGLSLYVIFKTNFSLIAFKYIFLIFVDILIMILISIKNIKSEIVAIVLILLFILINLLFVK